MVNNRMKTLTEIEDIKRRAGIVEADESGHQDQIQSVMALLTTMLRAIESGKPDTLLSMQREVIDANNTLSQILRDLQYAEMQKQVQ